MATISSAAADAGEAASAAVRFMHRRWRAESIGHIDAENFYDFTQARPKVRLERGERVIDWFCGLGNFTLPLATQVGTQEGGGGQVLGIEGSETLVARSLENARFNGVAERTSFVARNLFEITPQELASYGHADKWLVDPPREGAMEICKALADLHLQKSNLLPERIVYVSCNPKTLARDTDILCHQAGYVLKGAGIVNMFPHTSHVESMAVFERKAS